jgi:NAD-dependent deacetylase
MRESVRDLDRAATWLNDAKNLVVFSGAGISAESGIPTFRDADGLWAKYPPHAFASLSGLAQVAATEPLSLAEFVRDLLAPVVSAQPNPGHRAVAELESHMQVRVVTQNVDNLHQEAGSTRVFEVHGTLYRVDLNTGKTLKRHTRQSLNDVVHALEAFLASPPERAHIFKKLSAILKPYFDLQGGFSHRPGIVLFGEPPTEPDWTHSRDAVEECDLMLMVGTSGEVFPANLLPQRVRARGKKVIGVGPEEGEADLWLNGLAGQVLPELLARVQETRSEI